MTSTALDRFTGSDEEFLEGNEETAQLCPHCEGARIRWAPVRITTNGKTIFDSYPCGSCNGSGQIEEDPGDTAVILPDHDDYADRQG